MDTELLGIFIEEADEVLARIRAELDSAREAVQPLDALITIRRGFHTLKGSGRMVGLSALGEAAWGVEQTLNRWLQLDWAPTPALLHLIDSGQQLFSTWVEALRAGSAATPDASALLADAEHLRSADTAINIRTLSSLLRELPKTSPCRSPSSRASRKAYCEARCSLHHERRTPLPWPVARIPWRH